MSLNEVRGNKGGYISTNNKNKTWSKSRKLKNSDPYLVPAI